MHNNHPQRKPRWLIRSLPRGNTYEQTRSIVRDKKLHTVCQEALCPNRFECFSNKTAVFLILGDKCTRNCRFCNIKHATPSPPDFKEPERVAKTASVMGLDYVVVTSVTRDDLSDGGADIFARTIGALKQTIPGVLIEVLIPDFKGNHTAVNTVLKANPDVLNHNIETVSRLYKKIRPEAQYYRSLDILKTAKTSSTNIRIKSGLMVGLGETFSELTKAIEDIFNCGCELLTIGQYLPPSKHHLPVSRYLHPDEFMTLRKFALDTGFTRVESSPLVRSSYHAKETYF